MNLAFLALVQFISFIKASACKCIMEFHFLWWEKQSSSKSSKTNSASIIYGCRGKNPENVTSRTRTSGKLSKASHPQNSILVQKKSLMILSWAPFTKLEYRGMTLPRAHSWHKRHRNRKKQSSTVLALLNLYYFMTLIVIPDLKLKDFFPIFQYVVSVWTQKMITLCTVK